MPHSFFRVFNRSLITLVPRSSTSSLPSHRSIQAPWASFLETTPTWATNVLMYLEHLPEHIAVMEVVRALQGMPPLSDG